VAKFVARRDALEGCERDAEVSLVGRASSCRERAQYAAATPASSSLRAHTTRTPLMNPIKLAGLALVVLGALGLAYGSFAYTKDTHDLKLGPLELSVKEKETVNVPVWAGVVAIVLGGLLFFGARKS
jgi:hypothetical protein